MTSQRKGIKSLEVSTAPTTPASGQRLLYPKSDGWYEKDSSGVEYKTSATDPTNETTPANHGFKAWSMDPAYVVNNQIVPASGTLQVVRLYNQSTSAISLSATYVFMVTVGATLTNVGFGIWDSTGFQLQSQNNVNGATTAAFTATPGIKVMTYGGTSPTIQAKSSFYVGFYFQGTTMPTLARAGGTAGVNNANLTTANSRFATANTGLTTTPPTNLGTFTAGANAWWVAVS